MSLPNDTAPCNGWQCPSAHNCQRYTDWATFSGQPAAFWARREAGADSCESMVPVQNMSTFKE